MFIMFIKCDDFIKSEFDIFSVLFYAIFCNNKESTIIAEFCLVTIVIHNPF